MTTPCQSVRQSGAARPGRPSGFTLFELLVVLAVVVVIGAVAVSAAGGFGRASGQRSALDGIVGVLSRVRLDAMRNQQRTEAVLSAAEDREHGTVLELHAGDRRSVWKRTGLLPAPGPEDESRESGGVRREPRHGHVVDETATSGRSAPLRVVFDSAGRADRPLWRLAESTQLGTDASTVGRTLWLVKFDAVSGVPTAVRVPPQR